MLQTMRSGWKNIGALFAGNKKRTILLALAALILIALVWVVSAALSVSSSSGTSLADVELQAVEIGILEQTIAATGNIRAAQAAALSWQTSGLVDEVYVSEGDVVSRGEPLAVLAWDTLPASILAAQGDLLDAQEALADLYDSYSGVALAEAEQAVAEAQDAYSDALYAYNSLLAPADNLTVEDAYADLVLSRDDLEQAQANFDRWSGHSADNENRARAVQALAAAQDVYDDAARTYNYLIANPSASNVALYGADVAVAEATLAAAQAAYDRLLAGPNEAEIGAAEARIEIAQDTLNQSLVEAPFDGVITLALPSAGDYVGPGDAAFEMVDQTHYYMDVGVNELDVNDIQVGQSATIVLDANQDVAYEAVVVKVGSIGNDSSGVVTYNVVVELLNPDGNVRPGMTATASIHISSEAEALLVPNQSLALVDDQLVVYVVDAANSSVYTVPVTVGSSSDTQTQVLEGELVEGDLIVLNPEIASSGDAAGGGFGLFGVLGGGGAPAAPAGGAGRNPGGDGGQGFNPSGGTAP